MVASPGTIEEYPPPRGYGVRPDSHLYPGDALPIFYDSLIATLIPFDTTRDDAIAVMRRALAGDTIGPIETTVPLFQRIMDDGDFQRGDFDTSQISRSIPDDEDDDE